MNLLTAWLVFSVAFVAYSNAAGNLRLMNLQAILTIYLLEHLR